MMIKKVMLTTVTLKSEKQQHSSQITDWKEGVFASNMTNH